MVDCSHCGHKLDPLEDNFCRKCGQKYAKEDKESPGNVHNYEGIYIGYKQLFGVLKDKRKLDYAFILWSTRQKTHRLEQAC